MAFSPNDNRAERPIRWNCLVLLLIVPLKRVVLIRTPSKDYDRLSVPGGGDEEYELEPRETAEREFGEETGIWLRDLFPGQEILKLAFTEKRDSRSGGTHDYHLFVGAVDWAPIESVMLRGATGEVVELVPAADFMWNPDFHDPHREFLTKPDVLEGVKEALGV